MIVARLRIPCARDPPTQSPRRPAQLCDAPPLATAPVPLTPRRQETPPLLKTVITRTVAAIAITAAASTAALATGDTGNFTPANVSPTAPLDTIAVDPAANTLAEVNRQLAALGDGAETELLQRCAVINRLTGTTTGRS